VPERKEAIPDVQEDSCNLMLSGVIEFSVHEFSEGWCNCGTIFLKDFKKENALWSITV
jgi:hypothetical protein